MINQWREWARNLKAEAVALYLAYRHPRTPLPAKIIAAIVIAYAFSPIDLIPDFIPIVGYLDDLLLLPLGIALALYLIPPEIMRECREQAKSFNETPLYRWMRVVIILIWSIIVLIGIRYLWLWFVSENL